MYIYVYKYPAALAKMLRHSEGPLGQRTEFLEMECSLSWLIDDLQTIFEGILFEVGNLCHLAYAFLKAW